MLSPYAALRILLQHRESVFQHFESPLLHKNIRCCQVAFPAGAMGKEDLRTYAQQSESEETATDSTEASSAL